MKRNLLITCFTAAVLLLGAAGAFAQESADEMPPMGAPEQMKDCAALVGTWDCVQQMKMDMESDEWTESNAVATYNMILDGCALEVTFASEMMGMPFKGIGIQTFDRETGLWQMTWTDNMMARTSLYTGKRDGDKLVMTGEEMYAGETYPSRITTYNEKPESFDWMMETSMDGGKTWITTGKATYTKRK